MAGNNNISNILSSRSAVSSQETLKALHKCNCECRKGEGLCSPEWQAGEQGGAAQAGPGYSGTACLQSSLPVAYRTVADVWEHKERKARQGN